jgi:hypothetical protein
MIKECPMGRKSVFNKFIITAVFSMAFMCLAAITGSAQTQNKITCDQPTEAPSDTTPTTMGYFDFKGGYKSFDGGFETYSGVSSYTVVGGLWESLVTQIFASRVPTVAVNKLDQSQASVGAPCVATAPAKQ